MGHILSQYLSYCRLAGHATTTMRRRTIAYGLAERHALASHPSGEITRDTLESWLSGYPVAATRRAYLADMRSIYAWAVERGVVEADPTKGIPAAKVPYSDPRPFSAEQCAALRAACNSQQDRVVIELGLSAGLRVSEMAALTLDDVDFAARRLTVRQGKGGKDRTLPLAGDLVELLRTGGHKVVTVRTGPGVSWRISVVYERSEIYGRVPHDLRHTFATVLYRHTKDLMLVSQMLGHASIQTTLRYARLDPPGGEALDGMYGSSQAA